MSALYGPLLRSIGRNTQTLKAYGVDTSTLGVISPIVMTEVMRLCPHPGTARARFLVLLRHRLEPTLFSVSAWARPTGYLMPSAVWPRRRRGIRRRSGRYAVDHRLRDIKLRQVMGEDFGHGRVRRVDEPA